MADNGRKAPVLGPVRVSSVPVHSGKDHGVKGGAENNSAANSGWFTSDVSIDARSCSSVMNVPPLQRLGLRYTFEVVNALRLGHPAYRGRTGASVNKADCGGRRNLEKRCNFPTGIIRLPLILRDVSVQRAPDATGSYVP